MIQFAPEAVADLARVREFLDVINPEAAKRAVLKIFAALERVERFPELGRSTADESSDKSSFLLAPPATSRDTR
jgi:toxin ParE1/3/4